MSTNPSGQVGDQSMATHSTKSYERTREDWKNRWKDPSYQYRETRISQRGVTDVAGYYAYPEELISTLHPTTKSRYQALLRNHTTRTNYYENAFRQFMPAAGVLSQHADYPDGAQLLTQLIAEHGVFAGYRFRNIIAPVVEGITGRLDAPSRAALQDAKVRIFEGVPHLRQALPHAVSSLLLQAFESIKDDPAVGESLGKWAARYLGTQTCLVCGQSYQMLEFDEVLFPLAQLVDCCFRCEIPAHPTGEELKRRVRDFVEACGFVPPPGWHFFIRTYRFINRIEPSRRAEALRAYVAMGGPSHVMSQFGGALEAYIECDVLPEGVLLTQRGYRCIAKDGDVCGSLDERQIDDFLHDHGIPHKREPLYPPHPELNPNGRQRADWLVGEIFIEYFGLAGDAAYDLKTENKVKLARQAGITLIGLYPDDLRRLSDKLSVLIADAKVES
jgi:hypothetical protein